LVSETLKYSQDTLADIIRINIQYEQPSLPAYYCSSFNPGRVCSSTADSSQTFHTISFISAIHTTGPASYQLHIRGFSICYNA